MKDISARRMKESRGHDKTRQIILFSIPIWRLLYFISMIQTLENERVICKLVLFQLKKIFIICVFFMAMVNELRGFIIYVEGYNNGQHAKGGLIYLEIIP